MARSLEDFSERKHTLFLAAVCRQVADSVPDGLGHAVLERIECYADALPSEFVSVGVLESRDPQLFGLVARLDALYGALGVFGYRAEERELDPAVRTAGAIRLTSRLLGRLRGHALRYYYTTLRLVTTTDPDFAYGPPAPLPDEVRLAVQSEVYGPLDREPAFDPVWRTPDVALIAQNAYATRDFSALPILADALQDAGCDGADILTHLRADTTHVRGCWALDLVLGKS